MDSGRPDRISATLCLDAPVADVRAVSASRAKDLAGLGIRTVRDLLTHFPRRYIDLSQRCQVAYAAIGQPCTIEGVIHSIKLKRPRPNLKLVEIALKDATGLLQITCFRQPWLMDQLKPGMRVAAAGKVEFSYGFKRMTNPYLEAVEDGKVAEAMIISVHPATERLGAKLIRTLVGNALELCEGALDPLPLELRAKYRLMSRYSALRSIHFPQGGDDVAQARRRLVYEEVLLLELMLMMQSARRSQGRKPVAHRIGGPVAKAYAEAIPFQLTDEQVQAKDDIMSQLGADRTVNHMLLGDVGTGKTVVAGFALAAAADSGGQAAFLAPTEVLARQHGASLGPLLDAAGVSWAVLTGSTPDEQRCDILERAGDGRLSVLFGTHAILEDDVAFSNLTVAVVDEQQRFGVDQRAALLSKGEAVDALYLTATPIPRTLALALYGDLTLSYIKHRPHDSARRTTTVLPKERQGVAFDAAKEALARGEQVFVVCPLVGKGTEERDAKSAKGKQQRSQEDEPGYTYAIVSIESDADLAGDDVAAATKEAQFLQRSVFGDWKVELLHGRMRPAEKHAAMERFRTGESQVLVATTVIEVGVDVPSATVMIVEDADRFGLSQLHQLRGRVGRGELPAQVFLLSASQSDAALSRLAAMEKTDDGFELASYDLSLRREGDILGNRQHGASQLKLVNVVRDGKVIEAAHADAEALLQADPNLSMPWHRALAREVRLAFDADHDIVGG